MWFLRLKFFLRLAILLSVIGHSAISWSYTGAQYSSKNFNYLRLFAVSPVWHSSAQKETWQVNYGIINDFLVDGNQEQRLILDYETQHFTLNWERQLSNSLAIQLQMTWLTHDSDIFDVTIARWHDFFDLPNGGRFMRGSGEFLVEYTPGNSRDPLSLNEPESGFLEPLITLVWYIDESQRRYVTVTAELPFASLTSISDSVETDIAVAYVEHYRSSRWNRFWGIGLQSTTSVEQHRDYFEARAPIAWTLGLGAQFYVRSHISLDFQLDVQSATFDSPIDSLGHHSAQLTSGLSFHLGSTLINLSFVEDLSPGTSPDFGITFSTSW